MITVEFKDYEDMMEFAQKLSGSVQQAQLEPKLPQISVTPTVPPVSSPVQTTLAASPMQASVQAPQSSPTTPVPGITQTVPTTTQSYTLDDIARAAMILMDSGRQGDLLGLLANFGVDALPALPQAQYGAFATALRGMGAQI